MSSKQFDTSTDLLEKIYDLQKESAVSDAIIKKDVEHLTENVRTINEKMEALEERIDKQDTILSKLADQYDEIKCNKEALKSINERLRKIERKPYDTAFIESEELKTEHKNVYRTIRNTAITVFVSGIVGTLTGFIISLMKGAK